MALIETNFIRPQEVYDRNTGESKVRYRSYDGNDRFIPVVEGENGVPKTLVEVTHAELKAMRDGGKLTPGSLYRITDYNCTTTQENTQSAGHQFDIVLLALSENKLAEEGWAMMHENDTYFANSNLSAWKVWYCLDNDKSRFAWADPVNGKGVIYRLIDEWNNDVAYDFKNIQYVRPMTADGEYDDSTGTDTWVFTFSVYDVETQQYVDASIISGSRDENYMNYCWNNIISAFVSNQDNTGIFLPNNVFCQQMSLGDDLFAAIGDCYADGRSANNTIASSTMGIVLRRCDSNVISASGDLTIVGCYQQVIFDKDSTIILNGKAVLVET